MLSLVPFAYLGLTRLVRVRDFAYYVTTQIVPTAWIVWRLSDQTFFASIEQFALGLLAFTAIYEIGYLANDTWDAKRDPHGRRRTPFEVDTPFLIAFVAIRVAAWLAVGFLTGWVFDATWLVGFACLVVAILLHNALPSGAMRAATFLQLAILRILLPALGAVGPTNVVLVIAIAAPLYAHLRFLSYLDGKRLLAIPERKTAIYPLSQVVVFLPLAALISVATLQTIFLEIAAYFTALYGVNALRRPGSLQLLDEAE